MKHNSSTALLGVVILTCLFLVGCSSTQAESEPETVAIVSTPEITSSRAIILGDIDPNDPKKKIERFQPLADYLAERLTDYDITAGRVSIARNIDEMAGYMRDGMVDIYFDSAFPTLKVQEAAETEVILRRWKDEAPDYYSVYITLEGGSVASIEDLRGNTIAFEEPFSTSGFLLPAGELVRQGYELVEVDSPETSVSPSQIGYFFAHDEENIIELVLRGGMIGGSISNQDFDELPTEVKSRLHILGQTEPVTRQLVSVRPGLEQNFLDRVREELIGLEKSERGREILDDLSDTLRFDALTDEAQTGLDNLQEVMRTFEEG